jgi:hypothetical protein
MDRLKIMTTVKKILSLFLIVCTGLVLNGVLYGFVLSGAIGGLIGVVSLSFYVYYLLVAGTWCALFGFYMINTMINVSFKVIVIGVLPLPFLFLKVGGMFCLYGVMVLSAMILLA